MNFLTKLFGFICSRKHTSFLCKQKVKKKINKIFFGSSTEELFGEINVPLHVTVKRSQSRRENWTRLKTSFQHASVLKLGVYTLKIVL